ncbi:MAG: hypothetical protein ACKO5F_16495, partial [Synechococcus sp.]
LPAGSDSARPFPSIGVEVALQARSDRLMAIPAAGPAAILGRRHRAVIERVDGAVMARLDEPVALFIPPDVDDPSRRAADEELWVEVTLPPEGPPRPIRLGVRRPHSAAGALEIQPLRLRRPAG